jgi:peptidoglycan/xylan/chitin deacetylase (PgdA/CDA1 family)
LFQEIHHLLTRGQSEANAAIPALAIHLALLRDLIVGASIPLVEIPPVPDGSKLIACLTHDMDHIGIRNHRFDHTMFGFLYRATIGSVLDVCRGRKNWRQLGTNCFAALKLPLVHLGLAKDFWHSFDRYLAIEKGLNSTFFVIPKKNEPGMDARGNRPARRAAKYDAAGLGRPLKQLQSAGDEIAVHGIDAWRDSAAGRQEHEIISRLTGTVETGVRMHWLFFDEHSHALLEAAGFSYDSTVGYNQTIGYRAGTTQVFKPVTTEKLLELPLHLMDTALFYPGYLNLAPAQTVETVRPLIANTVRFGGVLTVNWHDRSVAPERLWDIAYVRLLGELRSHGACFLTAARTVSWFRKRRAALFEQAGSTIKIRVPAGDDTRLPGLCARSFQPDAGGGKFFETPLPDGGEISLEA